MAPRIALIGFMLESNAFAPVADEAEFRQKHWIEGEDIVVDARSPVPRDPGGFVGFCGAMDETGPWQPVPLAMTSAGASGPVEQGFFDRFLALIEERLRAALPVDGVYIQAHGACRGTVDLDPEGTLFASVRAIVGPSIPVVATLDLHANVSRRMVEETDLLIAYLTNPHVDLADRGEEAGRAMRELLAGTRTARAFVKLPILPPQVALLSDRGPYGEAIVKGQSRVGGPILNVSVLGNFSFGDSPKTGMSVVVTARRPGRGGRACARARPGSVERAPPLHPSPALDRGGDAAHARRQRRSGKAGPALCRRRRQSGRRRTRQHDRHPQELPRRRRRRRRVRGPHRSAA